MHESQTFTRNYEHHNLIVDKKLSSSRLRHDSVVADVLAYDNGKLVTDRAEGTYGTLNGIHDFFRPLMKSGHLKFDSDAHLYYAKTSTLS